MVRLAFNRAAAQQEGSSGIDFLEAILRERPDLREETAYFPGHMYTANDNNGTATGHFQGNCSHVVFIGDEVFKGPTELLLKRGESFFDEEYKTLKRFEGKNLPVPRVTYVGKETVFFAMTRLPGVQLPEDFMSRFTSEEVHVLADDLAGFITDTAEAFPQNDSGAFMQHFDLQPKNILINPDTKRLTGIVDFSRVEYSSGAPGMRHFFEDTQLNRLIYSNKRFRKFFGLDQPIKQSCNSGLTSD
jgi:hypothetical protein